MTIREAQPDDLLEVYELLCTLENHELPLQAFAETYGHNLEEPLIRYLVAEEDKLVGFISLHMDRQLHHASLVGEVQELIVREDRRGQGIGEALLKAAQEQAAQAGCSHMELNSNLKRTGAHAFYAHMGWEKNHYCFTYKKLT